jgi:hypothetical protein
LQVTNLAVHSAGGSFLKRLLVGVSLVALCSTGALAQTTASKPTNPAPPPPKFQVAPADEYFGRLKLSILGIRNTIKDLAYKTGDANQATSLVATISLTEDAIHDWEKKYPHDSWLPRSIFSLERLYAMIDSDQARAKAKAAMVWLVHDYPKNPYAITGRKELASNEVGVKPAPVAAAPAADQAALPAAQANGVSP